MREYLYSNKAPEPIGPYSQAIRIANLTFTSGQIALNREGLIVSTDIREQTRQVIENLKFILEDNGSSLDSVIKTTVFLKDVSDFTQMNEIYSEYFSKSKPVRSTVEVAKLPKDAKIMIDAIAYR
jgi:2-iminobutanoate/2-iminopropanoate deaminase